MLGLVDDVKRVLQPGFKNPGDFIALLGMTREDLSVSQYSAVINGNPTLREDAGANSDESALPNGRVSDFHLGCSRIR
jgi:phosphoribosylformylglycinamidine (FGAM) synthase-like enzyme